MRLATKGKNLIFFFKPVYKTTAYVCRLLDEAFSIAHGRGGGGGWQGKLGNGFNHNTFCLLKFNSVKV